MRTTWVFLVALSILIACVYPRFWRTITIQRWRKSLLLDKHFPIHQTLFANVDGFSLSHEARRTRDAYEYVYGEIEFESFIALLSLIKPTTETIFYDLGCGTGKAVLACAMVFNTKKSYGIELFDTLYDAACSRRAALSELDDYKSLAHNIHFIHGDIFHVDFAGATLIFVNATGFFGEAWHRLSLRIEQTTRCTTIITTSKALKSSAFIVTKTADVKMSWGYVTAYIQTRLC